jgi:hypothetical protein
MDTGTTAIIAAAVGATAAIMSGLGVEAYKRHRDRKGIASAIAGEISGIIMMTAKRRHVERFQGALERLDRNEPVVIPGILGVEPKLDPVVEKNLDKLGALGGDLPERIAHFYQFLMGIRQDLFAMSKFGVSCRSCALRSPMLPTNGPEIAPHRSQRTRGADLGQQREEHEGAGDRAGSSLGRGELRHPSFGRCRRAYWLTRSMAPWT